MGMYYDEKTGLPNDLRAKSAWVGDDGIGRCGECTFNIVFTLTNGWNALNPVERVFAKYGYEPCGDEWCSDCDRNTEHAEQVPS
jgi:hypothetical protein